MSVDVAEGGEWDASRWAGGYRRRLARRESLHGVWSVHPNPHGMASSLPSYIPTCLSSSQSSSFPTLAEFLCVSINKILLSALQNLHLNFSSEWNWKCAYVCVVLSTMLSLLNIETQHPPLPSIQSLAASKHLDGPVLRSHNSAAPCAGELAVVSPRGF